MTKSQTPKTLIGLAEDHEGEFFATDWAGPILALGTRLARKENTLRGKQTIVCLSVPSREYSAALIGAGWVLARPPVSTEIDPLRVLSRAAAGQSVRVLNSSTVMAGQFENLDLGHTPPRLSLGGRQLQGKWSVDKLEAAALVDVEPPSSRMSRPKVGSIGRMAGIDRDYSARLVAPHSDVAIIGTKQWINEDLKGVLTKLPDTDGDALSTLLQPKSDMSSTWFCELYSSSRLSEKLPLSDTIKLAILDGQGAIKYLNEILAPVVVCVFDRSVADESAAEQVIQIRNSRGTPISLSELLGWRPPTGVEAFSFTVAI